MTPKYSYKPLPRELTIKPSPIHGLGLYCTERLISDRLLGISHVIVNKEGLRDPVVRTPLGGFINHSAEPNCFVVARGNVIVLKTLKEIAPGEELTLDYEKSLPILQIKNLSIDFYES